MEKSVSGNFSMSWGWQRNQISAFQSLMCLTRRNVASQVQLVWLNPRLEASEDFAVAWCVSIQQKLSGDPPPPPAPASDARPQILGWCRRVVHTAKLHGRVLSERPCVVQWPPGKFVRSRRACVHSSAFLLSCPPFRRWVRTAIPSDASEDHVGQRERPCRSVRGDVQRCDRRFELHPLVVERVLAVE